MSALRVLVDRRAAEELEAAADWYEARRQGLGLELIDAAEAAVQQIVERPGLGGPISGVDPGLGVRRVLLRKFPYALVYLEVGPELVVLAFAHGHRRPGYWRDRLAR